MEFKLLVVDDEPRVSEVLSEFFMDRGYRVLKAASGDEAISNLERESVDLVVLDLHMPGLPGEEVLRHIKRSAPATKAVVVTGFPDREASVKAIGCDAFFTKPLALEKLVRTVGALLTDKDSDELREIVLGERIREAVPGQPVAQLLIFEPVITLSRIMENFFGNASYCGGTYKVYLASDANQAAGILLAAHPDIVLMDLLGLDDHPSEAAKRLLECEFQPKDYIFYLHPRLKEEEEILESMPAKRWEGNPFKEEGLKTLAELVRSTAIEHGLLKR